MSASPLCDEHRQRGDGPGTSDLCGQRSAVWVGSGVLSERKQLGESADLKDPVHRAGTGDDYEFDLQASCATVNIERMDYLRSLFAAFCADEQEVEGRSVLAFSLAIGHHFMAADHGAHERAEAVELAVKQLLR